MENAMTTKAANPIDKHVGSRVRMRRMMLSMSQEKLGTSLGLTFQQVQKYEKGTNRIGASRLLRISQVLDSPIQYFFDGAPGLLNKATIPDFVSESLATTDGVTLNRAFAKIKDPKIRRMAVNYIVHLATADSTINGDKRK